MSTQKHYRIETVYTLLQPLSHIGESESTQSFLNTTTVVSDGKPCEVFTYSGNAIRGALRDCGARYLLDRLGLKVPLKAFHLLFSGGSIGGTQAIDIDQAKLIRKMLPFVSLFGGGVGNQILDGKMKQTFAYPICKETSEIVPKSAGVSEYSWRHLTNIVEFSRKDDEKNAVLTDKFLANDQLLETEEKTEKKGAKKEAATQMRYGVEYLAPGAKLWHRWDIICDELELGAFVSALHEWQKQPFLGGMAGKGFGLVNAEITVFVDGEETNFMNINQDVLTIGDVAKQAKATYDAHLQDIYDSYLIENKEKFTSLLEGTV